MVTAYMEKARANSTLIGYVPSTVLLWNILIIFSLLLYIISKHRNFLVSAAFDFSISSTQQNNNNHYGGFRREVVVLFLTFNFIGITISLGSRSTKPSSPYSSSHVELDHLDWDFIGTCNHGVVFDQDIYDISKLLEANSCCEYCYNTINSDEEDDDNKIINDRVNLVDVDQGCEDYNEHDHVVNRNEAYDHGNCNDYDVISMDEDDVHGYDGYEEDNDDDDVTCGNAYDDDVESEADDDKEDKEELDRRIEELISKVKQKWREEILSDTLLCISAT